MWHRDALIEMVEVCKDYEIGIRFDELGLYLEKRHNGTKFVRAYPLEVLHNPSTDIYNMIDLFLTQWKKEYRDMQEAQDGE